MFDDVLFSIPLGSRSCKAVIKEYENSGYFYMWWCIALFTTSRMEIRADIDICKSFFRLLEFAIGIMLAALKLDLDGSNFVKKYIYNWGSILIENVIMLIGITIAVKLGIGIGNYMLYSWICLPLFALMLLGLSGVNVRCLGSCKLIQYCSSITYSLFLAQLFSNKICQWIIYKGEITNNLAVIGLGWIVCIAIALFFHEVLEKPMTRYFKKKMM